MTKEFIHIDEDLPPSSTTTFSLPKNYDYEKIVEQLINELPLRPRCKLTYLAVPYTHPSKLVRRVRFEEVNKLAAKLINQGYYVFSPITQGHAMAMQNPELRTDWEFWKDFNDYMLFQCGTMIVFTLPGWRESKGLNHEIGFARQQHIPAFYTKEFFENE